MSCSGAQSRGGEPWRWQFFLNRQEDLEDFFASFPEHDSFLLGWLLKLDDALVPKAQELQRAFSHIDWVTPQPDHFLHIGISGVALGPRRPAANEIDAAVESAEHAWASMDAFEVNYARVNCFHSAVIVGVDGEGPRSLAADLVNAGYWSGLQIEGATSDVPMDAFLAHLTIGTVNRPNDPATLRDALVPMREAELGRQRVTEATLCVIPASRGTILDPWTVVGAVAFGGHC